MIGGLLYFVLYPLSRYVTSRHSEASKKGLPPAAVNGKAVCDGGAVTTRRFTQSQKTLLDQRLNPCTGTRGETKERMTEPSPQKEDDVRPDVDKEELMAVLHEETQSDLTSEVSEGKPAENKNNTEMGNGQQQDKVESPMEEVREETIYQEVCDLRQNIEDGGISSPEQAPMVQECLHTEDSTQESTRLSSVQDNVGMPSLEESVNSANITAEVPECWDEYAAVTGDGGGRSAEPALSCLLPNTPTHLEQSGDSDTHTGWHFPAGPGLAEEVQCPLWDFPALSYYPQLEPAVPFEVTWRLWEKMDDTTAEPILFTKPSMDFTIMSYNILAQDLLEANQELYTHCPLEVLEWSYRCRLLLEDIQKWKPDILCLQEVQENHYHEHLCPVLTQMGYTCVYKRRTGTKTDGCATCFQNSCFSEVSVSKLEFFRSETELLDRHNVGIVLLLRPVVTQGSEVKAKGLPLCVANTHLLFNPNRGDVKLAQLAIMLAEIDSVVKSCKAKGELCNVVMCGDFNSVPHMPLYELIITGKLFFQGLPSWMISGQEDLSHKAYCRRLFAPLWPSSVGISDRCQYTAGKEIVKSQKSGRRQYSHEFMQQLRFCPAACVRPLGLELIPGVTDNTPGRSRGNVDSARWGGGAITHGLDLESVYKHVLPGFGNPEVTTLHAEGGATVDYIFYTPRRNLNQDHRLADGSLSSGLKLIGSLSLLSEDVLWSMRGLPNYIFPSDHLSLLAKFQLDLNAA